MMIRRDFLRTATLGALSAYALRRSEWQADIAIIGGGVGGCAAALVALEAGCTVVMTEPTDWIGGQLTQQGVPPDEHHVDRVPRCYANLSDIQAIVARTLSYSLPAGTRGR